MGRSTLPFHHSQDLHFRSTNAKLDDVQQKHDSAQCGQRGAHEHTQTSTVLQHPVMCITVSNFKFIPHCQFFVS